MSAAFTGHDDLHGLLKSFILLLLLDIVGYTEGLILRLTFLRIYRIRTLELIFWGEAMSRCIDSTLATMICINL